MEMDLRASLVAAGAAAALSALVGIVAGVGFFVLLLRAVVGGALLGAAVYGGISLLKAAVPGIFEGGAGAEADPDAVLVGVPDPEIGSHVDIVLPGEATDVEPLEAEGESFATKVLPDADADPGFAPEAGLLEPEGPAVEAEPAIPANAGSERERRSSGFDELDVLPDLDGFSDSFTASEFAFGGSSAERPERGVPAGSGGGSAKAGQEGLDPAAMALAVRSILKRDQKG